MKRVYLASPFFNETEISHVARVEKILRDKGLKVWSPRENQLEHMQPGTNPWATAIFRNDVKHIDWAECVVAIVDGNYMDSGTAWEVGYAFGTNKPVILVHLRDDANLMMFESAHANVTISELEAYDFECFEPKTYDGKMF